MRDEVLQMELARESSSQMRTIVSSIQKEQNDIIRDESAGTLVIQGAAGAGKTSIALHRVAYLLYRRRGRLTSDSVAVVSPNRVFGSYISNVLPELGEEPIRQLGMHELASQVLGPRVDVSQARSFVDGVDEAWRERAQFKATREFAERLTEFVDSCARWVFQARDLRLGELELDAEWLGARFASYSGVPFDERLEIVAEDALSHLSAETFERHGDGLPSAKRLRNELARMLAAKDPMALYREFFKRNGLRSMLEWRQGDPIEWEDAFPLALCSLAFRENDACRATGHLVIDEMQDLTPVQHVAVARLFRCEKTLLGDVNQLVDDRDAFGVEDVAAGRWRKGGDPFAQLPFHRRGDGLRRACEPRGQGGRRAAARKAGGGRGLREQRGRRRQAGRGDRIVRGGKPQDLGDSAQVGGGSQGLRTASFEGPRSAPGHAGLNQLP